MSYGVASAHKVLPRPGADTIDTANEPIPQVCIVPFRGQQEQLEVCLITSISKGRWIFPKGIIDAGETREEAALKEAWEEAGLRGQIVGEPLGRYEDFKWGRPLDVAVVMMEVADWEDRWPEADVRERQWATADDAASLLSKRVLREFLEVARQRSRLS